MGLASTDETAQILPQKPVDPVDTATKTPKPLEHPVAVRAILPLTLTVLNEPYLLTAAGDVLRTFDVSELDEPQLLSQIDGHSHDITAIRLWIRKTVDDDGKKRAEPWIITTSLDKTIRKWKLAGSFFLPCISCARCSLASFRLTAASGAGSKGTKSRRS
jgi:hypothetical protein